MKLFDRVCKICRRDYKSSESKIGSQLLPESRLKCNIQLIHPDSLEHQETNDWTARASDISQEVFRPCEKAMTIGVMCFIGRMIEHVLKFGDRLFARSDAVDLCDEAWFFNGLPNIRLASAAQRSWLERDQAPRARDFKFHT